MLSKLQFRNIFYFVLRIEFCHLQLTKLSYNHWGEETSKNCPVFRWRPVVFHIEGINGNRFELHTLHAFLLLWTTEICGSGCCSQWSACAWEVTEIGLMVTSEPSQANYGSWKLVVTIVQRHFATDFFWKILNIFLVSIWYMMFSELLFYWQGFICLSGSVSFSHLARQCYNSSVHRKTSSIWN